MKKKIITGIIIFLTAINISGCNFGGYDLIDTNYHFDQAVIKVGEEFITVDVQSWADSSDGEQLTITSTDGTRYMVNSVNCTLIEKN